MRKICAICARLSLKIAANSAASLLNTEKCCTHLKSQNGAQHLRAEAIRRKLAPSLARLLARAEAERYRWSNTVAHWPSECTKRKAVGVSPVADVGSAQVWATPDKAFRNPIHFFQRWREEGCKQQCANFGGSTAEERTGSRHFRTLSNSEKSVTTALAFLHRALFGSVKTVCLVALRRRLSRTLLLAWWPRPGRSAGYFFAQHQTHLTHTIRAFSLFLEKGEKNT